MQRNGCRINEAHINTIALKARIDNRECGYLWKRSNDSAGKWQIKWFALHQNFLFYYENVNSTKPLGLIVLESCYCNRIVSNTKNTKEGEIKLFCFSISYSKDGKNSIEFGAENEQECLQWIDSINNCSYNKQASQCAEIKQKYIHLSQLYDTESTSKWQYLAQIEELSNEVKQLREELKRFKKQHYLLRTKTIADEESEDMKRLKKVQSLCRGWLYRKRWKRIVKDYIESPYAINLRKRNRIVFDLVEKEGEYMSQLEILVSNFLRPFKMAACSSKPPITHEEVNSIFLNSEILLFLHQIFYKGLTKKLENWPTLFVGDLFDFLLPVLGIYQEYVRNHHYSLQILTDLKSKSIEFRNLLKRCEEKSRSEVRSLDIFLTYPMHQIPRYILILHELITYTSPSSVNELSSLKNTKEKLEELSRTMHDEVSATENIRCNLAIEKMIVEGCDCLLDANQVFIREGLLIVLTAIKSKTLGKVKDAKKRNVVKCFLFSNHLIITTRASNGRLNLFKPYEAIPLSECKIVEDITNDLVSQNEEENISIASEDHSLSISTTDSTASLFFNNKDQLNDYSCEFRLIQTNDSLSRSIHLIASSIGEKQSWCSDISQCIDNLNYSNLLQNTDISNSVNMPNRATHFNLYRKLNNLRDDPKLFKDDKDVKYCKTLNSCKIPQIRQATVEKLIERLTDLRFLSIDFLNTFLLTYRVFTDGLTILNALKVLYESSPRHSMDLCDEDILNNYETLTSNELSRRVSIAGLYRLPSINEEHESQLSPFLNKIAEFKPDMNKMHCDVNSKKVVLDVQGKIEEDEEEKVENHKEKPILKAQENVSYIKRENKFKKSLKEFKLAPIASCETFDLPTSSTWKSFPESEPVNDDNATVNKANLTKKSENKSVGLIESVLNNLTKLNVSDGIVNFRNESSKSFTSYAKEQYHEFIKNHNSHGNLHTISAYEILNGAIKESASSKKLDFDDEDSCETTTTSIQCETQSLPRKPSDQFKASKIDDINASNLSLDVASSTSSASKFTYWKDSTRNITNVNRLSVKSNLNTEALALSPATAPKRIKISNDPPNFLAAVHQNAQKLGKKISDAFNAQKLSSKLAENQSKKVPISVYAGVVVTSSRYSRRRTSSTEATKAFAVATSGSQNSLDRNSVHRHSTDSAKLLSSKIHRIDRLNSAGPTVNYQKVKSDWVMVNTAASMRVLNVLRHWVTKNPVDFDENQKLKEEILNLIQTILNDKHLTTTEKKVAQDIVLQLSSSTVSKKFITSVNLESLLTPPTVPGRIKFHDLSVSEIAEQMTFIDYQIFCAISSRELLGQAWMKHDKEIKAKNVLLFSKRFNEMSQLVVTEILSSENNEHRLEKIEKWTTIANICKFLKNFNGVLQIMSAFASTSVFRLKKTWEKLSKNTQQTIDTLQNLVSSDGRFKNLRDTMHKCDPPCIPYLGMYLMDLVFIEESTPDFIDGNLINFSKLRMVSHIIRDIRKFQHSKYTIHHNRRVCEYLLDTNGLLTQDEAYNTSLVLEPRNFKSKNC